MNKLAYILIVTLLLAGCQGYRTDKAPFHPNPNMDWQAKVKPQRKPMQPVEGTIQWGNKQSFNNTETRKQYLQENTSLYQGKKSNGQFITAIPIPVNEVLMDRGQQRYNIYCAVCHTETGNGTKSQISKRGWIAYNLLSDLTINRSDGELFDAISNGIRTMPGYKKQISVNDRWAIVLYVRALQKAAHATINDVPVQLRSKLRDGE